MKLRIGTRGSELALLQTRRVVEKLKVAIPDLKEEIKIIRTAGDLRHGKAKLGMFVSEINRAVLNGEIDIGVHSLKDLPTMLPEGLMLACIPERLAPNDALVSRDGSRLYELPPNAVIGTSSPRRRAEILHLRDDLRIMDIRGNIATRLRKLEDEVYDAIIVARAALERLNLLEMVAQEFGLEEVVPAVGQGAIGVVCREKEAHDFFVQINDGIAWREITCERAFLRELDGGCKVKAGGVARASGEGIKIIAAIHLDGRRFIKLGGKDPKKVGIQAAKTILRRDV